MQGPPVLLSYYVARVISCGPGALFSLSPFLGCLSGSSELAWDFVEPLRTYEVRFSASGCALHTSLCLGWAPWVIPCYAFSWSEGVVSFAYVISCAGGQVLPGPLRLRIFSDASGSLLPQGVTGRSYRIPLSPSSSGCRCHRGADSRPQNGLFRVL